MGTANSIVFVASIMQSIMLCVPFRLYPFVSDQGQSTTTGSYYQVLRDSLFLLAQSWSSAYAGWTYGNIMSGFHAVFNGVSLIVLLATPCLIFLLSSVVVGTRNLKLCIYVILLLNCFVLAKLLFNIVYIDLVSPSSSYFLVMSAVYTVFNVLTIILLAFEIRRQLAKFSTVTESC